MSLKATNLYLQMSPLPATFQGTPNDLAVEMIRRMRILSPSGTNFIFIGDVEPSSNVGPWLKGGTKWYVWDSATNRYVPLDVSDSITAPFWMGASTPAGIDPPVWLQTTQDATTVDPSHGQPIAWLQWNGAAWVPFLGIVLSGPSALRPGAPVPFQQYYDTDISALIWWERNLWRTVAGCPGDIKIVTALALEDAMVRNPGWDFFGRADVTVRGRFISEATKNPGGSPTSDFSVSSGVTPRAAGEVYGAVTGLKVDNTSSTLDPPGLALWHLVKL